MANGATNRKEVSMLVTWRTYHIKPRGGVARPFYAPDLDTAFALARGRWPWATTWECV